MEAAAMSEHFCYAFMEFQNLGQLIYQLWLGDTEDAGECYQRPEVLE